MKKFLITLFLTVLVAVAAPQTFAQEGHDEQAAEAAESEHEAEHAQTPLQTALRWANFLVLFGGLGYLLRKPIGDFFSSRRSDIASGLQRAQDAQAVAHARMDEIEQRLASLSAEIAALRSEAETESVADREKILAEARRDVDRVIEQTRQEIDRVARGIQREIKDSIADLVIDRAGKTLRTEMTQDDQKRVVVRFIKKL